jgi:hypothetical protein
VSGTCGVEDMVEQPSQTRGGGGDGAGSGSNRESCLFRPVRRRSPGFILGTLKIFPSLKLGFTGTASYQWQSTVKIHCF